MTIKVLKDSVINKISAGEVIERPANVIKELLENSLDAEADEIKIEIEDAGLTKIKISDNGIGMNREDLLLSYKRHTTSKIKEESDLFSISSLGFRGEALASIAEVSNLKIKSKTKENEVGNFIEIEGGIPLTNERIGCSNGTIIEISNIFYNVPARKKFLKPPEVELAHIIDIVTRYALIKKEISIKLIHNKKEIINSQRTESQLNNIIFIYGTEIIKNLIEVNYKNEKLKIQGYISKPNLTRANKNEQSLYVNERYVKNQVINNSIYSAYKTLLFTNRHPIYILNLTIKPTNIDVNIHPNKIDIRIKNEQEVCESFFLALKQALNSHVLIPTSTLDNPTKRKAIKNYEFSKDKQSILFNEKSDYKNPEKKTNKIEDRPILEYENQRKTNFLKNYLILGQINKTFILLETDNGLVIIDQHAAEERVNYELFLKQMKKNAIKKQNILHPKIIQLNPVQYQTAVHQKYFLEKIGFDFEEFGNNCIKLSSIPGVLGKLKPEMFIDIINEISKNSSVMDDEIEDKIIRYSCKASVKSGDEMSIAEIKNLIEKLNRTQNPYSCPHGRPTVIQLTNAELEKKFKRTGW